MASSLSYANADQGPVKKLYLASGSFDPLELDSQKLDQSALVQLVQARGPALEILAELRRRGCQVLGYFYQDSYLVRLPQADALDDMSNIRWRGAMRSDWKRAPALQKLNSQTANRLRVFAHSGRSLENLSGQLSRAGKLIRLSDDCTGTGHALLAVEGGYLSAAIDILTSIEDVAWVAPERRVVLNNDDAVWIVQGGDFVDLSTPLFDKGLTGEGQIIAIADSGLDTDACQFRYSAAADQQTFFNQTQPPAANVTNPNNKVITYYLLGEADAYDDRSKLGHGTHVSGCAAGDNYAHLASGSDPGRDSHDGMAPAAQIVFQDTGRLDGNQVGIPDSLTGMFVQAYNSGARIHNDSYGMTDPNTNYSGDSREVDEAAWQLQDLTIVFSTGNLGPNGSTLDGMGSTSKNPIVVGASLGADRNRGYGVCHFSSQGPTADNRLRPDLVAPGVVRSALETEWVLTGGTDIYGQPQAESSTDPPNNNCAVDVGYRIGTSFSAPLVSGAAALARQYFVEGYYPSGSAQPANAIEPSAALLKAVLVNSAESMGPAPNSVPGYLYDVSQGTSIGALAAAPNNIEGWGLLRLDRALYFSGDAEKFAILNDAFSDGSDHGAALKPPLTQGQSHNYGLLNVRSTMPLRVTLAWTDPAGPTGSGRALVNDLDLEVEDASGNVYKGNVNIVENRSGPSGAASPDNRNPLEQVILALGEQQNVSIRVIGRDIPGNGKTDPYNSTNQGYALVVVGDFEEVCPPEGCAGDPDGGHDAGHDAGQDAGHDAGQDAGQDAGPSDADSGPGDPGGDQPEPDAGDSYRPSGKVKGGCSCSAGGRQFSNAGWLLFILVVIPRRRRRHD
jgi:MYXO-CTERM domain-containing protein